jgi:membrane carboxypeptidase/penicillin-binding protein PbpC
MNIGRLLHKRTASLVTGILICCAIALHVTFAVLDTRAVDVYRNLASSVTYDRTGAIVRIERNSRDQVCLFASEYPEHVKNLVLAKEDQWFYFHPGVHPYRILRAAFLRFAGEPNGGASTITQQLAKILLNTAGERTVGNKLRELGLTFVLEYQHSKDDILTMYLNTVPLGGNIQGFAAAGRAYFDTQATELTEHETLQLLAALSNPSVARPLTETNLAKAVSIASSLDLAPPVPEETDTTTASGAWLELTSVMRDCSACTSSLDVELTERIRALLRAHTERSSANGMTHGAVAIVLVPSGELVALIGSPNPDSEENGMRINMALETRPIGSTVKPFVYLLGFMKGLRPYTLVEDREYKFDIETGFPLYPKNYDGLYRGTVTLEESLANSLNVPTVEVLRYATLPDTYEFFGRTLGFTPPQVWERYAYGIALGGLELDLLTLTHAFTLFAHNGNLSPLIVGHTVDGKPIPFTTERSSLSDERVVAGHEYVALVNAILSDRTAGVEQFGQKGSLNLSRGGYGVKTGTSRDYHDSWTVGFTGDYVVGVWTGNAGNTPMRQVSGALGAGSLWHDVMELMFTTPYYRGTQLDLAPVVHIPNERGFSYGLMEDTVAEATALLAGNETILFPHDRDVFLYTEGMRIPLSAREDEVTWSINGVAYTPRSGGWYPQGVGEYVITAERDDTRETITVRIVGEPATVPQ